MIIQSAPAGTPRLAIMMYEHTALCGQFARAFGNETFEPLAPLDLMVYVIAHHDAGWTEFDRDPVTATLPFIGEVDGQHMIERRMIGMIEIDIGGVDAHPAFAALGAADESGLFDDIGAHGGLPYSAATLAAGATR